MAVKKPQAEKPKAEIKSSKGARMEPQSVDAKAKAEKDYASHPKFDKFKREGK